MSAIAFQVEEAPDVMPELAQFYNNHYDELASDKGAALDPDYGVYHKLHALGKLHVVTARRDGELVGYYVCTVSYHTHYKKSLTAFTDIYYIRPDCRTGRTGLQLFRFVEKSLIDRGVERFYTSTRTNLDNSGILKHLGFVEVERTFAKTLR